jgi:hypothetical protein
MSSDSSKVTIESTEQANETAEVSQQEVVSDASPVTPLVDSGTDLRVEATPNKTVEQFFENDYGRIMDTVISNDGKFTEDLYTEFESNGHSRVVADKLLAAEMAMAELRTQKVVGQVGGAAIVEKALNWAAHNFTETQKAAINKQLQSSDVEIAAMAMQSLIAQSGAEAGVVSADSGGVMTDFFEDDESFQEALRDNVRMRDASYRNKIMAKLDRSIQMGYIQPGS